MALPASSKREARQVLGTYCEWRLSGKDHTAYRLEFDFHGHEVMLREKRNDSGKRGDWSERPVALFSFSPTKQHWTLSYQDRKGSWRQYPEAAPMANIEGLVRAIEADDMGLFWG